MKFRAIVTAAMLLAAAPSLAQERAGEDTAARKALDSFGRCIAQRAPDEARRVLAQDFRSAIYRNGLRLLSQDAERSCATDAVGRANVLRSSNLLFAGAVAENLLETGASPLNVRLARANAASPATFAPTDAVAQCLAKSLPDDVAALFASDPGSAEEQTAAASLQAAVMPCARAAKLTRDVALSTSALRAMVATASLRLISVAEMPDA